jgi:hypothetical protein
MSLATERTIRGILCSAFKNPCRAYPNSWLSPPKKTNILMEDHQAKFHTMRSSSAILSWPVIVSTAASRTSLLIVDKA